MTIKPTFLVLRLDAGEPGGQEPSWITSLNTCGRRFKLRYHRIRALFPSFLLFNLNLDIFLLLFFLSFLSFAPPNPLFFHFLAGDEP